ncbi:MAG: TlpA disulfide reductase family protein [Candidatus Pseudobacter hemicellulosilyticus]|uniref:TlpA disulfide reductase family protein n=1 Tax=Candidatus Pseudobacter hemicellulosilyticus TaxID=3121375 RepID=A0AAJ5WTQ2_9BACT|nr:MAG: TlpA disulfide reductase family protein [Pseudobacter sp.]
MKKYILLILSVPFFTLIYGQQPAPVSESSSTYFNGFQHYKDKNVDSAMFFVRKLAANPDYSSTLQDLLHNAYAQIFCRFLLNLATTEEQKKEYQIRLDTAHAILKAMLADGNPVVVQSARPIYYWLQAEQQATNDRQLAELVDGFTKTQLSAADLYTNRIGRYGLLIYQVVAGRKDLAPMADKLLATLTSRLQSSQLPLNPEQNFRPVLEKRTWYRFLYAYANFVQAQTLMSKQEIKKAGDHFKLAADYSPDLADNNNRHAYFYDMFFLLQEEKYTFRDDYVSYLTANSGDKQQTLSTLLNTALIDPNFKTALQQYYTENFSGQETFSSYWMKGIDQLGKQAPAFSLKLLNGNGKPVSLADGGKSKWMLLDFWGTWCSPCRKEHPDLEKFYKTASADLADKIVVVTVACHDLEKKVTDYMNEFQYTFPVAMADQEIEKTYKINSYPSKILISPQGKYVVIPFGADWINFIKQYASL